MSKTLILFLIICALGIGAVLVYAKNNVREGVSKVPEQNLTKIEIPKLSKVPTQTPQNTKFTPIPMISQVTQLQVQDITVGSGAEAKAGDNLEVNYIGALLDGRKFDSSYDRGQTFTFTLGEGQVIQGWDQGIAGMKVGGKRKLLIPSDLAYGSSGNSPIPPNTPLYFEVELININP